MSKAIADQEAHAAAQSLIHGASSGNATFANLARLVELVQRASQAEPVAIANMFSSNMGANVPWDRANLIPFEGLSNLLAWRDVREDGQGLVITMSHAFSAVSMPRMPFLANTIVNHTADVADGVIKGVQQAWERGDIRRFSMNYGYGGANRRGDQFGDHMAMTLTFGSTLWDAFVKARDRFGYR